MSGPASPTPQNSERFPIRSDSAKWLPSSKSKKEPRNKQSTAAQLVTHSSGYPSGCQPAA